MADSDLTPFQSLAWCRKFLEDPDYELVQMESRIRKADEMHEFLAVTLATPRTIPSCVLLRRKASPEYLTPEGYTRFRASWIQRSDLAPTEHPPQMFSIADATGLFVLGPGLNGWAAITHGGFLATLLDEMQGMLLLTNHNWAWDTYWSLKEQGHDIETPVRQLKFTATLNVRFRRPVKTGQVVAVRSWVDKVEGMNVWLKNTIEDGEGNVLAEGEGAYFAPKLRQSGGATQKEPLEGKSKL